MLKLKRIQIQGFKSFPDKLELSFDGSGVAAIVGPNGCGKSNISDAISWVLGEQSAKSLRGSRMEDVIFNGTRSRLPLGLAEVSITLIDPEFSSNITPIDLSSSKIHSNQISESDLDNPENGVKKLTNLSEDKPSLSETNNKKQNNSRTQSREVVVSRRLFRSGESKYRLNGRQVRLRDIQEVFLGTGLGPDSYAIIEQDRIGLILSSKPADRRAIIEEAAGITKFKVKRKLAESRLGLAKENLFRVNDITEEVSRQLNSLKRQAAKARRYRKLGDSMNELSKNLFSARNQKLMDKLEKYAQQFKDIQTQVDTKRHFVQTEEENFRKDNDKIFHLENELKEQKQLLSDSRLETETSRQKIHYQQEQVKQLGVRSQENSDELFQVSSQEEDYKVEVTQKELLLKEVLEQFKNLEAKHSSQIREYQKQQNELEESETACDLMRSEQLNLMTQIGDIHSQITQLNELEKQLSKQISRLEDERQRVAVNKKDLASSHDFASKKHKNEKNQLIDLKNKIEEQATELSKIKMQREKVQQQLTQKREETIAQSHRLQSLKELAAHHAYSTEAVKYLLSAVNKSEGTSFQTQGILADLIEVDPTHEVVVEEFLKQELEYLLVDSASTAHDGIKILQENSAGRATFLIQSQNQDEEDFDEIESLVQQLTQNDPRLIPVSGVVRLSSEYKYKLRVVLPQFFHSVIAPSYDIAINISQTYPQLTILTPQGEVIRNHVISGGGTTSSGHLSLKREIRDLEREVGLTQKELRSLEQETKTLGDSEEFEEEKLSQLNQAALDLDKTLIGSDHQLHHLQNELDNIKQHDESSASELLKIREEVSTLNLKLISFRSKINEATTRKVEIDQNLNLKQNDFRQLRQQIFHSSHQLSEVRSELSGCRERKVASENDLNRLKESLQTCQQRSTRLKSQQEDWAKQKVEIQSSINQIKEKLFNLGVRQASLESEIRTKEHAIEEIRKLQVKLGEDLQHWRIELEEIQSKKTQIEIDRAKLISDQSHLKELCKKELGQTLESIVGSTDDLVDEESFLQLEQQYEELRNRLDSIGPVNMMALEEFQECEKRFEFLSLQRQDLMESIDNTNAALAEIDQVSSKQFQEAFEAINLNFQERFQDLFGGGHGEMKLLDQQDLLGSGIEIIAQPPGKKLQNVLLLSGGEKALTAISLLLAIFEFQPSPFCVLDEVDAPLDDVNLGRYLQKIKSMSSKTQFLVITHNKLTMEIANTLFGVTMQEAGISKLVAVQLS